MRLILSYTIRFLLYVLIQVLVLNNIKFLGFINPYVYVVFILTLPMQTPRILLLFIAFLLGLSIDIFSNTLGVHAFATVFLAFIKQPLSNLFAPRDNYESVVPSMKAFGANSFVKYAVLMVLIHHFVLFSIEAFSFQHVGLLLFKILLNTLATLVIILSMERFKSKK